MKKNHLQIGLAGMMLTATILGTPAMAVQFTDVASNHWASASISKMVDNGVLKGIGNNKFDPTKKVTYAEFSTMLVREYQGEVQTTGDKWYTPYWEAAKQAGYLKGMETVDPNTAINRYEMALMLANAQPSMEIPSNGAKPADWGSVPAKYKDSVLVCYTNKLLNGMDKNGTFAGATYMNRAQAATILARLVGDLQTGETTPTTPTNPDKPPVVVTPPSSNIPAGATPVASLSSSLIDRSQYADTGRVWNLKELGNGSFECNANGLGASNSGIQFKLDGQYSKLTFTFQNNSKKMSQFAEITLPAEFDGIRDVYVLNQTWVKPGESKTFNVDITGKSLIQLSIGNGQNSNGILSNVYLTK